MNVTVHALGSAESLLDIAFPDIEVSGTLSTNAGCLVVAVQGHAPESIIGKAVQKQQTDSTTSCLKRGWDSTTLEAVAGAIEIQIAPPA